MWTGHYRLKKYNKNKIYIYLTFDLWIGDLISGNKFWRDTQFQTMGHLSTKFDPHRLSCLGPVEDANF